MTQETDLSAPAPLVACTISRDVHLYDLLIEDMEAALGPAWGDLSFAEAAVYLDQPEAADLKFVVLAMDAEDEATPDALSQLIRTAKARGLGVILVADNVAPVSLHHLLREGADEFVPYPLPEGELATAIARLMTPKTAGEGEAKPAPTPAPKVSIPASAPEAAAVQPSPLSPQQGQVVAVQSMAGGAGATTLAVNLADSLAHGAGLRVCLLDLAVQFGAVSAYLGLPRPAGVADLLADGGTALLDFLQPVGTGLQVLTAPAEIMALEEIAVADIAALIARARAAFDVVVIDLPSALPEWSEAALAAADTLCLVLAPDMRSVENTLRFRTMVGGDLEGERFRLILNRAPGFADLRGKATLKTMEQHLGLRFATRLAEGGRAVADACDTGRPLRAAAPRNALTRDIAGLAAALYRARG